MWNLRPNILPLGTILEFSDVKFCLHCFVEDEPGRLSGDITTPRSRSNGHVFYMTIGKTISGSCTRGNYECLWDLKHNDYVWVREDNLHKNFLVVPEEPAKL
jgi:hypothetical protein